MDAPTSNRLTPAERYERDAQFRTLVDALTQAIAFCEYTPTEIREAAMLAAIRYEERYARPRYSAETKDGPFRRVDGYHGKEFDKYPAET